ncbi:uncharacterized protein LOC144113506 [Amblyomma americanum]
MRDAREKQGHLGWGPQARTLLRRSGGSQWVDGILRTADSANRRRRAERDERAASRAKPVLLGDDVKDGATDGASEPGGAVQARRKSAQTCCCGDKSGFRAPNINKDDVTGIVVAIGGRFPCLHIGLYGLSDIVRYFVALDFAQISSGANGEVDVHSRPYLCDPYYTPRPNNRFGLEWMDDVLFFNLTTIANGGIEFGAGPMKVGAEYEPALRLVELRYDAWPAGNSTSRFSLESTAFLVVSLSSELRVSSKAMISDLLLVRKSEMVRNGCRPLQPPRQQLQPQHPQHHLQQQAQHQGPGSGRIICQQRSPLLATPTLPPQLQAEWLKLFELRDGIRSSAAGRLGGEAAPMPPGLLPQQFPPPALPGAPVRPPALGAPFPRPIDSKPLTADYPGGAWRPPHLQPENQQLLQLSHQLPQPICPGAWCTARQLTCLATASHMRQGPMFQGIQQNSEAFPPLIPDPRGVPLLPHPALSEFPYGAGLLPTPEFPPPLLPYGPVLTQPPPHYWLSGPPPILNALPPMRPSYDPMPAGYQDWIGHARNNLPRQPHAAASGLDVEQQPEPDMEVAIQVGISVLESDDEDELFAVGGAGPTEAKPDSFLAPSEANAASPP